MVLGAAYNVSVGGLIGHQPSKPATWLAIFEAGKAESFDPAVGHYGGTTVDVTKDTAANWGILLGDFIPFAVMERRHQGRRFPQIPLNELSNMGLTFSSRFR